MKRISLFSLAALAAAALLSGLVYAVLRAAHLGEPTVTTVYGATSPVWLQARGV